MAFDLISQINLDQDVDVDLLQDAMLRIRGYMLREHYDIDTSPASPFGNLVLQPLAKCLVILESTLECVLSDVQLENALNGIVCNCDFIQSFLKGLGVTTLAEANCTSWVRMKFNTEKDLPDSIDRGTNFLFGDTYMFHIYAPYESRIFIKNQSTKVSELVETYANTNIAIAMNTSTSWDDNTPNEWYIDLPVYGPSTAEVDAGDVAKIDQDLDIYQFVTSVEMLETVTPFEVPTDLASLIKLVRTIQPSANITSRANAISYTLQKFPKTIGVSPVLAGDSEMIRANVVDGGIKYVRAPIMDLYIKSSIGIPTEELVVLPFKFTADTTSEIKIDDISYYTKGWLSLDETQLLHYYPLYIKEMYFANDQTPLKITDTNQAGSPFQITNFVEDYLKVIDNPTGTPYSALTPLTFDPDKAWRIDVSKLVFSDDTSKEFIEENGNIKYYWENNAIYYFKVNIGFDRLPSVVNNSIYSPEVSTALNIYARPFVVCYVDRITVKYRKDLGKFFDRQEAIAQIYDLINAITYPTQYNDVYIADIMMNNGASGVIDISYDTRVRDTMNNLKEDDGATFTQPISYKSTHTMIPKEMDIEGVGIRNIQYVLPRENIKLVEIP